MSGDMPRVAVVGLGYWGPNLLRVLADRSDVDVGWICDVDPSRLSMFKRRYPAVGVTAELEDVVSDPTVDGVLLATPVFTHYELGRRCLEAGKHTFVEKPLAMSSDQARDLIERAGVARPKEGGADRLAAGPEREQHFEQVQEHVLFARHRHVGALCFRGSRPFRRACAHRNGHGEVRTQKEHWQTHDFTAAFRFEAPERIGRKGRRNSKTGSTSVPHKRHARHAG